jgi:hypothetical protein
LLAKKWSKIATWILFWKGLWEVVWAKIAKRAIVLTQIAKNDEVVGLQLIKSDFKKWQTN